MWVAIVIIAFFAALTSSDWAKAYGQRAKKCSHCKAPAQPTHIKEDS